MKRILVLTLTIFSLSLSGFSQQEKSKKEAFRLVQRINVPLSSSYSYYFVSELDCNTCVERLLNKVVNKQNKNSVYLIYYTPSKKRIAFSSTMFKDFILKDHFYLTHDGSLYDNMNKILPIGRGPYLFTIRNNTISSIQSYSLE